MHYMALTGADEDCVHAHVVDGHEAGDYKVGPYHQYLSREQVVREAMIIQNLSKQFIIYSRLFSY